MVFASPPIPMTGLATRASWMSPANAPVTRQLAQAYRLLDALAQETDEAGGTPPRFLYVFSDRTRSSWDANEAKKLRRPEGVNIVFVDVSGTGHPVGEWAGRLAAEGLLVTTVAGRVRMLTHVGIEAAGIQAALAAWQRAAAALAQV